MRKTYKNPFYECGEELHSVKELVMYTGKEYAKNVAYRYKVKDVIIEKTYQELLHDVRKTAQSLNQLELEKKHIAILGKTSYGWIVTYLAVLYAGMIAVPLDTQLSEDEQEELLKYADVDIIILDEKYLQRAERFKTIGVKKVVSMGEGKETSVAASAWTEPEIDPKSLAVIVFTSGTTGKAKGVMLSQKNLISDVMGARRILGIDEHASSLSILPLYHTYEMTCDILLMLYFGASVNLNDSLKYLNKNLKCYKPTTLFAVPMVVEELHRRIMSSVKERNQQKLFHGMFLMASVLRKLRLPVYKKIFQKVRDEFGGNLNLIICGGACLEQNYIDFFDNLGINIVHGYGITECSPLLAANPDGCKKKFSAGAIVPCCEVKIQENKSFEQHNGHMVGEILAKGDNVMLGYYKDSKSTSEAMEGEWFHTGDIGYLDKDNYLYITGRVKNLIILSNGKNISPEELERKLLKIDIVKEVVVTSKKMNGRNQIHATIFPDYQYVTEQRVKNIDTNVKEKLKDLNKSLPSFKQITSYELRETEFIKTPTKKIKR